MNKLSNNISQLQDEYDVVIIGSGYGGSIAASRMARAGKSVCLLERGREIQPGGYPDTPRKLRKEIQVNGRFIHRGPKLGLFSFHFNRETNVIVGCGLGGTSLINANVCIMPEKEIFANGCWPKSFQADLENLYTVDAARARAMLRPQTYPENFPELQKLKVLETMAGRLRKTFYRVPINVTFQSGVNHVGVEQKACIMCGDCVTGCNHRAKNTLIMNYLPDAKKHNAHIFTCIRVTHIEKGESGWKVHVTNQAPDEPGWKNRSIRASKVILSAGTLGSTEILLRSKEKGLVLSDMLGQRFSGNGDFIGFSYNGDELCNNVGFGNRAPKGRKPVGPCITGIIDMRGELDKKERMLIEDCAIHGPSADFTLVAGLGLAAVPRGRYWNPDMMNWLLKRWRQIVSLFKGPYSGAVQYTQGFLTASLDDGSGIIFLRKDRPRITWPGAGREGNFEAVSKRMLEASEAVNGTFIVNPLWNKLLGYDLITAHPLGGCIMADDASVGVVNHKCQVFSGTVGNEVYKGLYVMDGAVIASAICSNPLLTISSVAERACRLMAEDEGFEIIY